MRASISKCQAEAAEVDAEDGHRALLHQARHAQQRPVPPEHDDQVRRGEHLLFGGRMAAANARRAVRFHEDGNPARGEPGSEVASEIGRLVAAAFDDDADRLHAGRVPQPGVQPEGG